MGLMAAPLIWPMDSMIANTISPLAKATHRMGTGSSVSTKWKPTAVDVKMSIEHPTTCNNHKQLRQFTDYPYIVSTNTSNCVVKNCCQTDNKQMTPKELV